MNNFPGGSDSKASAYNVGDLGSIPGSGRSPGEEDGIRDTKGTFHAKMGLIRDRNGMDLQKQKILRRGGKNTQKNYTEKIFMAQIITVV